MTNEQIKCPVCDKVLELDVESSEELGLVLLLCRTEDCSISRITPKYAQSGAILIQSRIDKEKAAAVQVAVQQERERWKSKALEVCYAIEKCGCSEELTNASILASELHKELEGK